MVQDLLTTGLDGTVANQLYEGDRRSDIVVRLPERLRTDVDGLSALPVMLSNGNYIPLSEVADLQLEMGYNQVYRENGKRRVVIATNVRGRDLGSFVQEIQQAVKENVDVPAGYWIEYGGTYQKLQSATQRLSIVVPLTLVLVLALLMMALGSLKDAAIIFSGVPLALTGGIMALLLRDIPFSISAAVGFIALLLYRVLRY